MILSPISLVAFPVSEAKSFTSPATTAKPFLPQLRLVRPPY
ncbi:hypothetical protein HMPREF0578_1055 [Mobiluncus mulieris 28-1]|nr:hypothetical protein HMPREF0578_1055 [Mobiluncus mulieris 28-1]